MNDVRGTSDVDDAIIDQGVGIVRKLWDAGLAHCDVKPANLLVRDGELFLIDVAFVETRPTPWRQAVDLVGDEPITRTPDRHGGHRPRCCRVGVGQLPAR